MYLRILVYNSHGKCFNPTQVALSRIIERISHELLLEPPERFNWQFGTLLILKTELLVVISTGQVDGGFQPNWMDLTQNLNILYYILNINIYIMIILLICCIIYVNRVHKYSGINWPNYQLDPKRGSVPGFFGLGYSGN